jgi:uncharacterized PurR-regulated membrane protein YhhQ (DUF165 family)
MKKNKKENDVWIYVLLLTTLVILTESLKTYTFEIMGTNLTYSLFLLPIAYFLIDVIAKKFDYKRAIAAIAVSGVTFVAFSFILAYFLDGNYILRSISGEFCAYVVSAFTNLTIYVFLLNNTDSPRLLVILTYLFSLIVYYMLYTLMYINKLIFVNYWTGYFITLIIQVVICIVLAIVDKKVERGQ